MASLRLQTTPIEGVNFYARTPFNDSRGSFQRLFCNSLLESVGVYRQVMQINHSFTKQKGSVRGLHMQTAPSEEMKIVSCIKGKVFDVAVDLRPESKTYLQYYAQILDDQDHRSLIIPEGCAHGFQTLSDDVELIYLHTANYDQKSERGVNPFDENIAVQWPETITEVSEKDRNLPNTIELKI